MKCFNWTTYALLGAAIGQHSSQFPITISFVDSAAVGANVTIVASQVVYKSSISTYTLDSSNPTTLVALESKISPVYSSSKMQATNSVRGVSSLKTVVASISNSINQSSLIPINQNKESLHSRNTEDIVVSWILLGIVAITIAFPVIFFVRGILVSLTYSASVFSFAL